VITRDSIWFMPYVSYCQLFIYFLQLTLGPSKTFFIYSVSLQGEVSYCFFVLVVEVTSGNNNQCLLEFLIGTKTSEVVYKLVYLNSFGKVCHCRLCLLAATFPLVCM